MKFWHRCVAVFLAMTALDIVFAFYVIETAHRNALPSSFWAAMIQVFNVFVVSSFVADRRLSVPCIAGAFAGTYITVQFF